MQITPQKRSSDSSRKKVLVILSSSPYGSSRLRSGIDYCLAAAAFEQNINLLLLGNAGYLLIADQKTKRIHQKNLAKMVSAFPLYGISRLFIDKTAARALHQKADQAIIPSITLNDAEIKQLISESNTVLTF